MHQVSYLQALFQRAREVGLDLLIENRNGLLLLKVVDRRVGTIAMWPAFDGSVEKTARYAVECFERLRPSPPNRTSNA